MKAEKITIVFQSEKLNAIKIFAPEVYQHLEEQLTEQLEKLYQKTVPQTARIYVDELCKLNRKKEDGQENGISQVSARLTGSGQTTATDKTKRSEQTYDADLKKKRDNLL